MGLTTAGKSYEDRKIEEAESYEEKSAVSGAKNTI